jgi:hypothetical protein
MPDLLTHLAAARVPAACLKDRRIGVLLVFGTFLPDLVNKGLYWVTRSGEDFAHPSHSVAGLALLCYLAALFVEESLRRPAFGALLAGGLVHLALDTIKTNGGFGASELLYPFSLRPMELGWIHPEDVIFLIPFDALVLLGAWLLERRFGRVRQ